MANLPTQIVGRMGELIAELELLSRGWLVANVNASTQNARSFDLFANKDSRMIKVRVKAGMGQSRSLTWSAKKDGTVFTDLVQHDETDVVIGVLLADQRDYDVYIIPTYVVDLALRSDIEKWMGTPARDGSRHKETSRRTIAFNQSTGIGRGYERKWLGYHEAWHLLDG